jgi:signal transduction histidine kinase
MNDIIQFIFLFLIGTTVINFGISIVARVKTGNKEFNQLNYYWASLFLTFAAVALLNKNPTQIAFAYFFQFIPAFLKTKFLRDSRGIRSNWTFFLRAQAAGMVLSTFLLLYSDVGFTISLLPVTFTTCLPYWEPVWNALVTKRDESNWIEKGLSIVLLTSIVNHFNFAFFRLDESTAWWGWSISIAQYQSLMIFLPLLINHRRESNEIKNLKHTLAKFSNENVPSTHSSELYQQLEMHISQKELFFKQLQDTNSNLEEEREMNEMLIRTISHDLANPLTVIGAYIEMLHSGRINPEDSEKIWGRLRLNTQSALDMIGRIRNAILTRGQASFVSIHDVSVERSLKRTLDQFETRIKDKNLSIKLTNNVSLDTFVQAEENALCEHVFANILSNAIKFSYAGSEIEINVTEIDGQVKIEFRDHGTGIQVSRFEKRILMSTQGTKGEVGTGFGLMVMGYFLRTFGATIDMKSRTEGASKGTSVIITLNKSTSKEHMTMISSKDYSTANIFS